MFRIQSCLLSVLLTLSSVAYGHGSHQPVVGDPAGRFISFPDGASFKVLTLDPHTHSVFSDGHVWPYIRVEEALRDGLDAFAVTEHLEYQPHLADIRHPDRNRSVAEARSSAEATDLIIIAGSEITRDQPVGHINALFVTDANALVRWPQGLPQGDVRARYEAAIKAALLERRTVAWFKNLLIGRERDVEAIVGASISVDSAAYQPGRELLNVVLRNHSDATFELENRSEYTFMSQGDDLKLPAHGTLELVVKTGQRLNAVALPFAVRNALVAPKTHAQWVLNLKL